MRSASPRSSVACCRLFTDLRLGTAGQERRKAAAPLEPDVVYRELASAMLGFDVDAVTGQDVAVVTDQECLVYLRRPL